MTSLDLVIFFCSFPVSSSGTQSTPDKKVIEKPGIHNIRKVIRLKSPASSNYVLSLNRLRFPNIAEYRVKLAIRPTGSLNVTPNSEHLAGRV